MVDKNEILYNIKAMLSAWIDAEKFDDDDRDLTVVAVDDNDKVVSEHQMTFNDDEDANAVYSMFFQKNVSKVELCHKERVLGVIDVN